MLKLNPNPTFAWPVKFKSPEGEQTLNLVFKHMPVEQYEAWWDAAMQRHVDFLAALEAHSVAVKTATEQGAVLPEVPKPAKAGIDELMDIVAGWSEVDAEFSREALQTLLSNYHGLTVRKITEAWIEGLQQRKVENS